MAMFNAQGGNEVGKLSRCDMGSLEIWSEQWAESRIPGFLAILIPGVARDLA